MEIVLEEVQVQKEEVVNLNFYLKKNPEHFALDFLIYDTFTLNKFD
jgi:hypothetical protein